MSRRNTRAGGWLGRSARRRPKRRICSTPAARPSDRLSLRPLDCLEHDPPRLGGVSPLADADPFVGLEILVVGEEVLDLLEHDRREVLSLADVGVIRKSG